MAQSTHIASGQSALAGSGVTVASGGQATFSLDAGSSRIPGNIGIPIYLNQGSSEKVAGCLTSLYPFFVANAPGEYYADRPDISAYGVDVAVLVDQ